MENITSSIPTAEEFYKNKSKELKSDPEDMPGWMIEAAKELAALHVNAALKKATRPYPSSVNKSFVEHTPYAVDSILKSYPKENIK